MDERIGRKESELVEQILSRLPPVSGDVREVALFVVRHAAKITAPERPERVFEYMTASMLDGSVSETRPGNIRLDLATFVGSVANGALTLASVAEAPRLLPAVLLALLASTWKAASKQVDDVKAVVLWALLLNRDDNSSVLGSDVPRLVVEEAGSRGLPTPSTREVDEALDYLREAGVVETSRADPDRLFVTKWVAVTWR